MKKEIRYDLGAYRRLSHEERRAVQQSVDIVNVERALTVLLAGLGGVEVDRDFFRHDIPLHHENGYAVRITDGDPGEYTDVYQCLAVVWGRHTDHDGFRQRMWRMANALPLLNEYLEGEHITPIVFSAVYLDQPPKFALNRDHAQIKTEGMFIVNAWILTIPESLISGAIS